MANFTTGTGYNKTYTDRNRPFSGWYYDDQQNVYNTSRLLTVSLHANSVPVTAEEVTEITDGKDTVRKSKSKLMWYHHNNSALRSGNALLRYPYGRLERDDSACYNKGIVGKEAVSGYFIEPLCTCFTSEDFNITVSNNYQQAGGDMVEQTWNSIKPMAPAIDKIIRMGDEFVKELDRQRDSNENGLIMSSITNWLYGGVSSIHSFVKETGGTMSEYLNKSLVLNGARFSYYGGTNLAFNTLGMKFTIFPKWYINNEGNAVLRSVVEQVNDLLPYVVGQYSDWSLPSAVLGERVDGVLGWMTPPGDFRMNSSDVDIVQKGTLKLKIGAQYSLTNLVIESASFNFSKQMVKNPAANYDYANGTDGTFGFDNENFTDSSKSTGALSPLYCEVNLQLRPITKYTSQMLERFISGTYNRYDIDLVNSEYNKNLYNGKKDMEERYMTNQPGEQFIKLQQQEDFQNFYNSLTPDEIDDEPDLSYEIENQKDFVNFYEELTPEEIEDE